MWVVGYDPADTNDLLAGGLEFWLRRHGSPFFSESENRVFAHWIPITSIPALRECATSSDFILISVPELGGLRRDHLWTEENPPAEHIRQLLSRIDASRAIISIEFTYHADFGSNTIERIQNLIQPAILGIPSFISMPMSVIQNRGTGRLGNMTNTQRYFHSLTSDACETLVRQNLPVTYDNVTNLIEDDEVLPRDLDNGGQANEDCRAKTSFATWKVPLMTSVINDSWEVCYRIPLPMTTVNFPDRWKMAGCQLTPIFEIINSAIVIWENEGRKLAHSDDVIENMRVINENALRDLPPPNDRTRNAGWDAFCAVNGYPRQSRAVIGLENPLFEPEFNRNNHHTLLSPNITTVHGIEDEESWQDWVEQARIERNCTRSLVFSPSKLRALRIREYGNINIHRIPEVLRSRPAICTIHIKDYTAGIATNPVYHPMRERSYLGRALMMDLVNFRCNLEDDAFPRAVITERGSRNVIYAADLPITSEVFQNAVTDNSIAEWFRLADIYVLEDGIFLGREWTRDGLLRLA